MVKHGKKYLEVAKEVDEIMIQSILTEDTNNFINTVNKQLQKGYEGLVTCACGQQAIVFGMTVAKNLGLKGKLLKYANSGDVTGDFRQVVGYSAIAWE